jgi:hypothetical protein
MTDEERMKHEITMAIITVVVILAMACFWLLVFSFGSA